MYIRLKAKSVVD